MTTWKWPSLGDLRDLALSVPSSRNGGPDTSSLELYFPWKSSLTAPGQDGGPTGLTKLSPHCGPLGGRHWLKSISASPASGTWSVLQVRAELMMSEHGRGGLMKASDVAEPAADILLGTWVPERNPWDRHCRALGCLEHWASP